MNALDRMIVPVQADWKAWQTAEVLLPDLEEIHWLQPSQAPHVFLHGYIMCTSILAGDIPHNCGPTGRPHRLLVCVIKKHVLETTFNELARRAALRSHPQAVVMASSRLP